MVNNKKGIDIKSEIIYKLTTYHYLLVYGWYGIVGLHYICHPPTPSSVHHHHISHTRLMLSGNGNG